MAPNNLPFHEMARWEKMVLTSCILEEYIKIMISFFNLRIDLILAED